MATYSSLSDLQIQEITRNVGLNLDGVEPLKGGMANSSFIANSERGRVVVTVLDNHDLASARQLAELMMYLGERGVPTQQPIAGVDGAPVFAVDGKPVMVKEFIAGEPEDPIDSARLADVGVLLRKVHETPAPEFVPEGGRRLPATWRSMLGESPPGDLVALLEHASLQQRELALGPVGLVHGDLFADNLVLTPDERLVILDWETAAVEPFAIDVGITAVAMCRSDNRLDEGRLELLLAGYEGESDQRRLDRKLVLAAVECGNALLAFHRYYRHNVRYPNPANADLYMELVEFGNSLPGYSD